MNMKNSQSIVLISALLLTFVGLSAIPNAEAKDKLRLREYYLTVNPHDGANALLACAQGFHMASMWEILDPSNLSYNTELGKTAGDTGFGPPVDDSGWVRTGQNSFSGEGGSSPGRTNCLAYTSNDPNHFGTAVELPQANWDSLDPKLTSPWLPFDLECSRSNVRVWCIEDINETIN